MYGAVEEPTEWKADKFYGENIHKDYLFLAKCHDITYSICVSVIPAFVKACGVVQWCFWKQNCTKPEDRNTSKTNETWYVAGMRSEWNNDTRRREFELYCCKSKGLKMVFCNTTRNYTDHDQQLVISRAKFRIDF